MFNMTVKKTQETTYECTINPLHISYKPRWVDMLLKPISKSAIKHYIFHIVTTISHACLLSL